MVRSMNKLGIKIWKICCLLILVFAPHGIKMDDYGEGDKAWAASKGSAADIHLGSIIEAVDLDHNGDGCQKQEIGAESFKNDDVRLICSKGVCKSISLKPSPAKTTARSLLTSTSNDEEGDYLTSDLSDADDDDGSSLSGGEPTDGVNNCERDEDPSWFTPASSFSPCQDPMTHLKNCGDICKTQESTVGRCLNDECQCCTMSDPLSGWFTSRGYLTPCRDGRLTDKTACEMGCSRQGAKKGTCVAGHCICSMEDLW